jgi:hypothetical protein
MQLSHLPLADARSPDQEWLRELYLIESSYGRLVYLAGLLNPNTGQYEHFGAKQGSSDAEANRVLRRCHEDLFRDWGSHSLERKMADVQFYIAGLGSLDKVQLIDAWLRLTPYKNLVPAAIQGPERQKHISDFEAILGLLKNVYGVASPDLIA